MLHKKTVLLCFLFVGSLITAKPSLVVADCADPKNCPCDSFGYDSTIIRATVSTVSDDAIFLVADEFFVQDSNESVIMDVGDTFGGELLFDLPCDTASIEIKVGDNVIAIFTPSINDARKNCQEYKTCTSETCSAADADWDVCDAQCIIDTAHACAVQRNMNGTVSVMPYADSIILRPNDATFSSINIQNIAELLDGAVCEDYFPYPPGSVQPCNDTPISDLSCSMFPLVEGELFSLLWFIGQLFW